VYAFLAIALATIVVGLTIRSVSMARAPDGQEAATSPVASAVWSKQQLYPIFGTAAGLGVIGALLVGLGRGKGPLPSTVEPQRISGATGLPVIGQIFPAPPAPTSTNSLRWVVFPAELVLMIAVLLSFHAAATKPDIARQFVRNPFAAYTQSVQDWQAQIIALRDR
jgi:hypothetical protein